MLFCPTCANMLLVKPGTEGNEMFCQTCPYVLRLEKPVRERTYFQRKDVDDVLGGSNDGGWDETDVQCLKCDGTRASYMQLQIRSADEPMTTFYRCRSCKYTWREN
ncbi:hypothetical protein DFJ73DRAFT_830710 [Zopfochytrium polystomum]|nr:hypothetical protein DFJ73DRAFT_830710 [Zopfochytrium polystomum]